MKTSKSSATSSINTDCTRVAGLLKSLSHPQRLMLLCYIAERERSVSELVSLCEISQSQVSQFLGRMKSEGLLRAERNGSYMIYQIADPQVEMLILALYKIFGNRKESV